MIEHQLPDPSEHARNHPPISNGWVGEPFRRTWSTPHFRHAVAHFEAHADSAPHSHPTKEEPLA